MQSNPSPARLALLVSQRTPIQTAEEPALPRAHRYDTLTIDADYPLFAGAGEAEAKQRAVDVHFERANDAKVLRALFLFDAPCRLQRYTLAVFGPTP